jgi:hypothetical protein
VGRAERVEIEHESALPRQVREVAPPEHLDTFEDRLLGSGRDEQDAQALGRALQERARYRQQGNDAGRVVVCARHHLAHADIGEHGHGTRTQNRADPGQPTAAERGAERDQSGAG